MLCFMRLPVLLEAVLGAVVGYTKFTREVLRLARLDFDAVGAGHLRGQAAAGAGVLYLRRALHRLAVVVGHASTGVQLYRLCRLADGELTLSQTFGNGAGPRMWLLATNGTVFCAAMRVFVDVF